MNVDKMTTPEARVLRKRAWIAKVRALSPVDVAYDVVAAIHHDRNRPLHQIGGS
jgi:hypothetical protein